MRSGSMAILDPGILASRTAGGGRRRGGAPFPSAQANEDPPRHQGQAQQPTGTPTRPFREARPRLPFILVHDLKPRQPVLHRRDELAPFGSFGALRPLPFTPGSGWRRSAAGRDCHTSLIRVLRAIRSWSLPFQVCPSRPPSAAPASPLRESRPPSAAPATTLRPSRPPSAALAKPFRESRSPSAAPASPLRESRNPSAAPANSRRESRSPSAAPAKPLVSHDALPPRRQEPLMSHATVPPRRQEPS